MRRPSTSKEMVYLNVYDLHQANEYLHSVGLGAYHSGVEVGGKEWTFAGGPGAGIFYHTPREAPGGQATYRESIEMGEITNYVENVARAKAELDPEFGEEDYNILNKNCNHFAEALIYKLTGKNVPGYVNRLAFMGSFFSCLMPRDMQNQAPVNNHEDPSSSSLLNSRGGQPATSSNFQPFQGQGHKLGGTDAKISIEPGDQEKIRKARTAALMKQKDKSKANVQADAHLSENRL